MSDNEHDKRAIPIDFERILAKNQLFLYSTPLSKCKMFNSQAFFSKCYSQKNVKVYVFYMDPSIVGYTTLSDKLI